MANSVEDLHEVAHDEPPHQDLHFANLAIFNFSFDILTLRVPKSTQQNLRLQFFKAFGLFVGWLFGA